MHPTKLRSLGSLLSLLLLLLKTVNAQQQLPQLPSGLGQIGDCLNAATDLASGLDCVTSFTDCFDGASILSIFGCLGDAAGDLVNGDGGDASAIEACLSPYATCIEDEIQKILDSLPDCLNTTVTNLGTCFYQYGNACNSTCSGDRPTTNPFAGVDATTLSLCNSFQSDIMDPTCVIVDCCEPCVDEVEAFMNCFVQNALDLKQPPPNANADCVLECPAASARRRQLEGHGGGGNDMEMPKLQAREILQECGLFLETSDGLNGLRANIEELYSRIVEGTFLNCVFDTLFGLADQGAKAYALQNPPTAAPNGGTTDAASDAGNNMASVMGLLVVVVAVVIGQVVI